MRETGIEQAPALAQRKISGVASINQECRVVWLEVVDLDKAAGLVQIFDLLTPHLLSGEPLLSQTEAL